MTQNEESADRTDRADRTEEMPDDYNGSMTWREPDNLFEEYYMLFVTALSLPLWGVLFWAVVEGWIPGVWLIVGGFLGFFAVHIILYSAYDAWGEYVAS